MASSPTKRFTEWFNTALKLYDEDKLHECVDNLEEILADDECPRYIRMKSLVLLGGSLGDWTEANECCLKAETLWRITRRWNPVGRDALIEEGLAEIRGNIDALREVLDEDRALHKERKSRMEENHEEGVEFDDNGEVQNGVQAHGVDIVRKHGEVKTEDRSVPQQQQEEEEEEEEEALDMA